jgi:[acyl-carrier-protein] S-malonyltransferase
MVMVAVFPGQGAQQPGMGRALACAFPEARAVFEEVDEALGERLSALAFEGPAEALTLTANAQPALMATSMAAVRAVEARTGRRLPEIAGYVAGHSLGEWSALAAAGAVGLADAARLLRLRGLAMQDAVPAGEGAMAALLGVDPTTAEEVAAEAAGPGEVCELANDNGDGQAVLSGHRAAVERALGIAKARGARRAVLLQVSAPFHCALMAPAAERLRDALAAVEIAAPAVPVIANVTAEPTDDPAAVRELLARQVTARVRWRETVATMRRLGADAMVELGAGRVLTGLAKRGLPGAALSNVQEPADVEAFARALDRDGAGAA